MLFDNDRLSHWFAGALLTWAMMFFTFSEPQEKKTAVSPGMSGACQILTPTDGIDFSNHLNDLLVKVRRSWFTVMPEDALQGKEGRVVVRFQIQKDGALLVKEPTVELSSKNAQFDKAAVSAIRSSAPFQRLPEAFSGPYIELRFIFLYNLPLEPLPVPDATEPSPTNSHTSNREVQQPFDKLELFAFFAAGPINSYSAYVIQQRGTNFTPDGDFISYFPVSEKQTILRNVKPRIAHTPAPDRDQAYELVRKAYDAQLNHELVSAGESYQQALQLAPNSATLHLAYASNLLLSHNYAAADEQMRQSIKLWPDNAEAHSMLALSMTLQRRNAEAELESQEALRVYPQHQSAKFTLAHSLTNQRKYQEALPIIREAMAALPSMAALRKFLGIALLETGDTAGGIEQLLSYVKLAPDDAEGHYYLGVALRLKGSSAEAHEQFLEATRLQPNYPPYEVAAHPETAVSAPNPNPGPKPEDGSVSGNTYSNGFFGFTYQFPTGWAVLSAEAARGMMEIGSNIISTGDPTEQDLKKAAKAQGHQLLYVMESRVGGQPISGRTVVVSALEMQPAPITAERYIRALGQRFSQKGGPLEVKGSPEERAIRGRTFWMQNLLVHTAMGTGCAAQFVTTEKGYLLMFSLSAPDPKTLEDLEKSLESIHLQGSS